MKKSELIIITIISIALGTGMHFAHHLPFFNHFLGYIFPINECVWEHMKMLFYPMLLTSIYTCCRKKSMEPFGGMTVSSLVCIPIQIALFYAYWVFVRHSILIVDIIAYVLVMSCGYAFGFKLMEKESIKKNWKIYVAVVIVMIVVVAVLTYHNPDIHLFWPEEE